MLKDKQAAKRLVVWRNAKSTLPCVHVALFRDCLVSWYTDRRSDDKVSP